MTNATVEASVEKAVEKDPLVEFAKKFGRVLRPGELLPEIPENSRGIDPTTRLPRSKYAVKKHFQFLINKMFGGN